MPSNHLILCHPLLLLPSIFPSIRVFSNESALCIRWPKYWSFSFSISPSNKYSGLISFRIDWFDLLAVQGTFKSLQQRNLKVISFQVASISLTWFRSGQENSGKEETTSWAGVEGKAICVQSLWEVLASGGCLAVTASRLSCSLSATKSLIPGT